MRAKVGRWSRRAAAAAGVLALALGAAGAAGAELVEGEGLVVGKSLEERTVTLSPRTVLHVDAGTRIVDAEGGLLPFVALPVAREVGGLRQLEGDAMVRYQASRRQGELVAEWIHVLGEIPD